MNIRDEINKTIAVNCYTEEDKPEDSVIMGEDFGKLADDLVKFCNLHFVIVPKGTVCPRCKSEYVYYWAKDKIFECDDCNEQWQTAL